MKLRGKAGKTLIVVLMLLVPVSAMVAQDAGDAKGETPAKEQEKIIFSYDAPVIKRPGEKRWFFTIGGMYNRKVGNTDTMTANLGTDLIFDNNVSELELLYTTFYGETRGKVIENKGAGSIKYDHYIFPRVEVFIFSRSEYSEAARLDFRNNSGLGAKYVIFKNYFWLMDISAAPVYQYEDYRDRNETYTYRWSFRYRLKITPYKDVTANYVSYYIPKVTDFEHYRLIIDAYLNVKILTNLSLKLGYNHLFNKNALPGTKRYDDTSYVQISLNL